MLNIINLVGRVARDPELIYTPGGTAICNLIIATNESYKNSAGDQVEEAQFHSVRVFGKQAEACKNYLIKGQEAIVTGRLVYRKYDDNNFKNSDDEPLRRVLARILASRVKFGSKPRGTQNQTEQDARSEDMAAAAQELTSQDDTAGDTPGDDMPL